MNKNSLEGFIKRLKLARNYIDRLNGQEISDKERIFLKGSVLWENEQGAKFEMDHPDIVAKMRQIKQDINNILKG